MSPTGFRIISGLARNVELSVPSSGAVRPTSGRARKALFDSLGPWEGRVVADLFAGSGALGLEAASRGASDVIFVEQANAHVAVIEKNIAKVLKTDVESRFHLLKKDVTRLDAWPCLPDVIFCDPPYEISAGIFRTVLELPVMSALPDGTLCVWEIPDRAPEMRAFDGTALWRPLALRNYGSVWFWVLKCEKMENF